MEEIFEQTPTDKRKVFEDPQLMMTSDGKVVHEWKNTQSLYFYPFSWLDYINSSGICELQVLDGNSRNEALRAINQLDFGKIHLETPDSPLIEASLIRGFPVSLICNLSQIEESSLNLLSALTILRVRVDGEKKENIRLLERIVNKNLLICAKAYLSSRHEDYFSLGQDLRARGIDIFQISKQLALPGQINPLLDDSQKRNLDLLKGLETDTFKVRTPSSLEKTLAERFFISANYQNTTECSFSRKRKVISGKRFYPCYTRGIVSLGNGVQELHETLPSRGTCTDCACIYENDMYSEILLQQVKFKNPRFLLRYKHGK